LTIVDHVGTDLILTEEEIEEIEEVIIRLSAVEMMVTRADLTMNIDSMIEEIEEIEEKELIEEIEETLTITEEDQDQDHMVKETTETLRETSEVEADLDLMTTNQDMEDQGHISQEEDLHEVVVVTVVTIKVI